LLAAMLACLCTLPIAGPPAALAGTPEAGFTETIVAQGLSQPTAIALLPDGAVLIAQKPGQLLLARRGVAATVHSVGTCSLDEGGLLGLTLDPAFGSNGFVYLYKTSTSCAGTRVNEVLRMAMTGDQLALSGTVLTGIPADTGRDNGGGLRIGPDGKLYAATGDAGTGSYASDPGNLAGKVLRLEPSGGAAAGNPFPSGNAAVYAIGFRDPLRFGFDPQGGRLWLGDAGPASREEIDVVNAGGDYGWPACEGDLPPGCPRPAFTYSHADADSLGRAVTGGAFSPASFGPYGGQYFFGDRASGNIYRVPLNGARDGFAARPVPFVTGAEAPQDIQFGSDGGLYYVAAGGSVRRVGPATGVGSLTDRTPPRQRIRIRKRQRLSRISFGDTVNEPATLTATGTVIAARASRSKTFRLRKVVRSAQPNHRVRIRMKLRKRAAATAARLVRRGKRTRVRITVSARDAAGNVSTARRTVRITRR
jgi:glucose/arabinose dehydrogenase